MWGLILLVFLLTLFDVSLSVPAHPFPERIIQPDGTQIEVVMKGDEFFHWTETREGFPVVRDRSTGWWYYAKFEKGKFVKTSYIAGKVDPEKVGIEKTDKKTLRALYNSVKGIVALTQPPSLPHTQNLLVILVQFNDVSGNTTVSYFQSQFFGTAQKSVKDYFDKMSLGRYTIQPASETSGTSDGIVGWITIDSNHPDCEQYSGSTRIICYHNNIVEPALQRADSFVNFANYDEDGNGYIEPKELSIIIVVAGYEAAMASCQSKSNLTWAHRSRLVSPLQLDGKAVADYAVFGEIHCMDNNTNSASIGVIIHELGHLMLGLPDLYDIDGSSKGIGGLGVMGSGSWGRTSTSEWSGTTPVYMSAWTRIYTGFLTPAVYSNNSNQQNIPVEDYTGNNANIIRVNTNSGYEYFLVTYRSPKPGTYDEGLKIFGYDQSTSTYRINNGGIFIWHIDDLKWTNCQNDNTCNANENDKMVDFEEADGSQDLDQGNAQMTDNDFFSNTGANQFNANTNPNSNLKNGSPSGVSITVASFDNANDRYLIDLTAGSGGAPSISVSPLSKDFGNVEINKTVNAEITISNSGTANLSVSSMNITGTDSSYFSINPNGGSSPCGNPSFVVIAGSSCTVVISVSPTKEGKITASLEIISNDPNKGIVTIQLTATGIQKTGDTTGNTQGNTNTSKKKGCYSTNLGIFTVMTILFVLLRRNKRKEG